MKKIIVVSYFVIISTIFILQTPISVQALPNPPIISNTTWTGKYQGAYDGGFKSGTMTLKVIAQSGALFYGDITFAGGWTGVISYGGLMTDGELRLSAPDGFFVIKWIYDNSGTSAVWKMTGYWQNMQNIQPICPNTGSFLLLKE
jgi:hypothetical protein